MFNRHLDWLLNFGKQESEDRNNHGTGYSIQVSSIAIFLNKANLAKSSKVQTTAHNLIAG
jgi:hypothetical protein